MKIDGWKTLRYGLIGLSVFCIVWDLLCIMQSKSIRVEDLMIIGINSLRLHGLFDE